MLSFDFVVHVWLPAPLFDPSGSLLCFPFDYVLPRLLDPCLETSMSIWICMDGKQ